VLVPKLPRLKFDVPGDAPFIAPGWTALILIRQLNRTRA
jgi:hypothetical protein